jgi:ABC-2 type transport system ATP-binding protein
MLCAENLSQLNRGRVVLDAIDIHVALREIVAVIGPEAAEKTAVLECFLGLRFPSDGRVTVAGFDVARHAQEAVSHLAYIPARVDLPRTRSGLAHTREYCALYGRRIPDAVLRTTLVRGGVALEGHERRIADYSSAQRRKLALTLATLKNADGLLLDEPTCDLNASDTDPLVRSLRGIRKRGTAVLLATHDLAFARRIATRVVLLERGAVVETFDPNASRRAFHADSYLAELVA